MANLFKRAENTPNTSFERQFALFVFTQICFGFSPKLLISTRIARRGTHPNPTDKIPLIYCDGHFFVKPRKYDGKPLFGTGDPLQTEIYRQGGHILKVSVPPLLQKLIECQIYEVSPKTEHLFFTPDATGKITPLKIERLNGILSEIGYSLREKIDITKIGRSAALHLIAYGNLDDVLAALIRGYVTRDLGRRDTIYVFHLSF